MADSLVSYLLYPEIKLSLARLAQVQRQRRIMPPYREQVCNTHLSGMRRTGYNLTVHLGHQICRDITVLFDCPSKYSYH